MHPESKFSLSWVLFGCLHGCVGFSYLLRFSTLLLSAVGFQSLISECLIFWAPLKITGFS